MKHGMVQLGIHVSDQDLSLVAAAAQDGQIGVVAWQRISLDPETVKGGCIQSTPILAKHIAGFLRTHRLTVERTTVSLTLNVARLKVTQIKAVAEAELHDQIMEELDRYTPFGRKNTYATYQTLPKPEGDETVTPVLQVMASRRAGDSCLGLLRKLGLTQSLLEVAVLPLIRNLGTHGFLPSDGVSVLCVLDAVAGAMCVLRGSTLAFCQNIPFGWREIVTDRTCLDRLAQVGDPVIGYAESLSDQGVSMHMTADADYEALRTIVMRVRHRFPQVRVRQLNSVRLTRIAKIPRQEENRQLPILALSSALAPLLAGREAEPLNLIPPGSLETVQARREISRLGVAIIAVIFLALAAVVPVNLKTQQVEAHSEQYESQIAATLPMQRKIEETKKHVDILKDKLAAYREGAQLLDEQPWPKLLAMLVNKVPEGLRLMEFNTGHQGEFNLAGEALSEQVVHHFVESLQAESLLETVEVEQVQYGSQSAKVVDYTITGRLADPSEAENP